MMLLGPQQLRNDMVWGILDRKIDGHGSILVPKWILGSALDSPFKGRNL